MLRVSCTVSGPLLASLGVGESDEQETVELDPCCFYSLASVNLSSLYHPRPRFLICKTRTIIFSSSVVFRINLIPRVKYFV